MCKTLVCNIIATSQHAPGARALKGCIHTHTHTHISTHTGAECARAATLRRSSLSRRESPFTVSLFISRGTDCVRFLSHFRWRRVCGLGGGGGGRAGAAPRASSLHTAPPPALTDSSTRVATLHTHAQIDRYLSVFMPYPCYSTRRYEPDLYDNVSRSGMMLTNMLNEYLK